MANRLGKSSGSVYAFDGNVALGRMIPYSIYEKHRKGVVVKHNYFVARDGIGYWVEEGNRGVCEIKAHRLQNRDKVITIGRVAFGEDVSPDFHREASTFAQRDIKLRSRFTIYWDKEKLNWCEHNRWLMRPWLKAEDFDK